MGIGDFKMLARISQLNQMPTKPRFGTVFEFKAVDPDNQQFMVSGFIAGNARPGLYERLQEAETLHSLGSTHADDQFEMMIQPLGDDRLIGLTDGDVKPFVSAVNSHAGDIQGALAQYIVQEPIVEIPIKVPQDLLPEDLRSPLTKLFSQDGAVSDSALQMLREAIKRY